MLFKKIITTTASLIIIAALSLPTPGLAAGTNGTIFQNFFGGLKTSVSEAYYGTDELPTGTQPLNNIFLVVIVNVLNQLLTFAGVVFFLLVIYAGYLWIMARGNEEQISKAKKMLREVIIGLIIILLARLITEFILAQLLEVTQLPTAS